MRPIIKYFGGKQYLTKKIIELMPHHIYYLEPFFGAGSVFFAKKPAKYEFINDIDEDLYNFYKVLRDPEKVKEFQRRCSLTLYSRSEYDHARQKYEDEDYDDDIDQAHVFYILANQSFSGGIVNSWSLDVSNLKGSLAFKNKNEKILNIHKRLQNVQIECKDFFDVWETYVEVWESKEFSAFVYLDPPYVAETRRGGKYQNEFSTKDHERLIETIIDSKVKVMVSGYENEIYRELEKSGWNRIDMDVPAYSAGRTRHTGILGEGVMKEKNQMRKECLWMNYDVQKSLEEFV